MVVLITVVSVVVVVVVAVISLVEVIVLDGIVLDVGHVTAPIHAKLTGSL